MRILATIGAVLLLTGPIEAQIFTCEDRNVICGIGLTYEECCGPKAEECVGTPTVKFLELTNDNGAVNVYEIAALRVKTTGGQGIGIYHAIEHHLYVQYRGSSDGHFYRYPTLKAAKRDYRRLLNAAGEK
jgi:hypothetical protein